MKTYTIKIEARTQSDVDIALAEVSRAIEKGCISAPWTPDEEDNGFCFTSEGEFD